MRRALFLVALLALILSAGPLSAQKWVNHSYPWSLVEHQPMVEMIDDTKDSFVVGTDRGFLYFLERDRLTGHLKVERSREVWAPVKEVRVADATGDQQPELIVTTRRGELFVINLTNLENIWRTTEGYFENIASFTVADVDDDAFPEILLIADELLVIMSGEKESEEFRSSETFKATMLRVADVDNDGAQEIVMNTGLILDARFRQLEWNFGRPFGPVIDVMDIDGDNIPEVIGNTVEGDILVIDVDERRVKWR